MEKTQKTPRSSNLEILRIIAMILIIMSHYASFSGFYWDNITTNTIVINFFSMFGRMSVSIFIIISRFFL